MSERLHGEAGFAKRTVAIGTAAALGLGALGFGLLRDGGGAEQRDPRPAATAESMGFCDDSEFGNPAAQADLFIDSAFLPKTEALSSENATQHIDSLFDDNGPLGSSIDRGSLAAVEALITAPAHDGVATDPNYSYLTTFREKMAAYNAEGGLELAEDDCGVTRDTLVQTASYNEGWAQAGETVVLANALRNLENYHVTGLELKEVVTTQVLGGIQFRLNTSVRGIDGFVEVLLAADGNMYLKGLNPNQLGTTFVEEGPAGTEETEGPVGTTPTEAPTGGGGVSGNDGGGETEGGAPGGDGPGCDGVGTGCEGEGPGGPGGPGGNGDDEEGPAPTTPPATSPPATSPPATSPPTTQPEPTPTTSTTQPPEEPKGEEPPADCANNPYDPRC
jgi:hypothetical protein